MKAAGKYLLVMGVPEEASNEDEDGCKAARLRCKNSRRILQITSVVRFSNSAITPTCIILTTDLILFLALCFETSWLIRFGSKLEEMNPGFMMVGYCLY